MTVSIYRKKSSVSNNLYSAYVSFIPKNKKIPEKESKGKLDIHEIIYSSYIQGHFLHIPSWQRVEYKHLSGKNLALGSVTSVQILGKELSAHVRGTAERD